MKKIMFIAAFFIILSTCFCLADEVFFDGSQKLQNVDLIVDPVDESNKVGFWKYAPKGYRLSLLREARDLSKFQAIRFRFYSKDADNRTIFLTCPSNPPEGKGNYYKTQFVVDWKGWKDVVLAFGDFEKCRKPVGWKKIDNILFGNQGWGKKADENACYYIDDVTFLDKAPPIRANKNTGVIELSGINTREYFKFNIDPASEYIYGISYEARGAPGTEARIWGYRTYDAAGNVRDKNDNPRWGDYSEPLVTKNWETKRIELMTKKGSSVIELTIGMKGKTPVKIRNVRILKGGFPDNPPVKEAPYLAWIDSLKPDLAVAAKSTLLEFKKGGCEIMDKRGGRAVYVDDAQQKELEEEVAPFMSLSPQRLIELTPVKRPFRFNSGYFEPKYKWTPANPDVLYEAKTGRLFEPEKEFPVDGYEEVIAPSGKKVKYAYHDYTKADEELKPQRVCQRNFKVGERVYLDSFNVNARMNILSLAGQQLSVLYRKTGNIEYGVRAAAILWAICRNMPDWPVYGQPSWNSPKGELRLQSPDYYSWFSFVMGDIWYVTEGSVSWLARYFDIIRDTAVWQELVRRNISASAKDDIADSLLHIGKMYLKRDAYYRNSPFVLFHNLSGTEHNALMVLGRSLGIPDLTHYALRKVKSTLRKRFMADGVFPESMWYSMDQFGRQAGAIDVLENYNDPESYVCTLDGLHLSITDPKISIPEYGRLNRVLERQTYPNGDRYTIHDSWAESAYSADNPWIRDFPERQENSPYLFSSFGHGVLGRGVKPARIEAQLHFSGFYNHGHKDMLNLILWAYGDELVSDIGYSHVGSYANSTASHNLVVVNKSVQAGADAGSLLCWNSKKGAPQIVQASQGATSAYNECNVYRRALVLLPFGEDNAVLDIFEVNGGKVHDWISNGCADYQQKISCSLTPAKILDNMSSTGKAIEDPRPWGSDNKNMYKKDKYGEPSIWYGAYRNAKETPITGPWTLMMTADKPAAQDAAWAGNRAKSGEPKAGVRLHWLEPEDGLAYIAEGPRGRYNLEANNHKQASEAWAKNRMPKIIVRREGENLKSMFVALWEPFHSKPFLGDVKSFGKVDGNSVGWKVGNAKKQFVVLYRSPEKNGVMTADGLTADGRFAIKENCENGDTSLYLTDGNMIAGSRVEVRLNETKTCFAGIVLQKNDTFTMNVAGRIFSDNQQRRYSEEFVCFRQTGQSNRWLKVKTIQCHDAATTLTLAEDPGFSYDPESSVLKETYFPYRVLHGSAEIVLPSYANIHLSEKGDTVLIKFMASNSASIKLKNFSAKKYAIKIKDKSVVAGWRELPGVLTGTELSIEIPDCQTPENWLELEIQK